MTDKAEVEKKDDKGITIKLDIPAGSLQKALSDGIEAKILAGAVEYMLTQLTPELLHAFVENMLKEAFKTFSSWKVREILDKTMAPMIDDYARRPEVLAFIRQNVEKGINEAISTLPDTVKTKLIERAVDGMTKAWRDR